MVDQIFELVGLLTCDGILLEVNQSALNAIQTQRVDVLGQPFWEVPWWVSTPELHRSLQAAITQAAHGQPIQVQVTYLDAAKTLTPYKLQISPIQEPGGQVQFITVEGHPLVKFSANSDEQSAQGSLEMDLQNILDTVSANVGCFRVFANGEREYLYFSAGSEKVFGYSAQELIADQSLWMSRVYPEDQDTILRPLNRQLFVSCPGPVEYRFIHKDGSMRWISSLYTAQDDTPESRLVTVVSTDITGRKLAEEALQQQLAQTQLVQEIVEYIRQSLDLDEVLHRTVERVRQYLQTDRVLIFRFDLDWLGQTVMESVGPDWITTQQLTIDDSCFREQYIEPYRLGRVSAISDIYNSGLADCHIEFLERLQVRASIVVPILEDAQLWGLLIAHHCASVREWQPEETHLLQRLSTHLSIAIQQSELYQQVHQELLERRQIQAVLQASEARFRALSDSAPIGIFLVNADGACSYTNSHWQALTGLSFTESLGEGWKQAIHPNDQAQVLSTWASAIQHCHPFTQEFRFVTPQGAVRWIAAYAEIMRSETGEVLGYVETDQDITERKVAEFTLQRLNQELELKVQQRTMELEQLLQQERVLGDITHHVRRSLDLDEILNAAVTEVRQVLQADRALIFHLTSEGSGVVIKEAALPDYPLTLDMRFLDECFPPDCYAFYCQGQPRIVQDVATDDWADCLAEFMAQIGVKSKIVAPIVQTGEQGKPKVWGLLIVHSCAYYRQWQSSEAALMQQVSNQVAIALQQAELHDQLQTSEALFRSAFDSAVNGMAILALDGQVIQANQSLCQLLGYTESKLRQLPFEAMIQSNDLSRYRKQFRKLITAQTPSFQLESALMPRTGDLRWVIISASLVRSTEGDPLYFVVQVHDVTERRALEQMKNEFISVVSHELRTPLTSIRGSLGLLVSGVLDHQSGISRQMLEIAAIESERMVRLVNDILDLERLENRKLTLNPQWCSATSLIQQAVESVQPVALTEQVALNVIPTEIQVWADPDRVIQILVNLVSNAIKFSAPSTNVWIRVQSLTDLGSPLLQPPQVSNASATHETARQVCFAVIDQGKGIPADKLEIIFERFQQVNASDSRDKGGTGLGLTICRNIVHQHGGRIWVESVLGKGSTFYFTLPFPYS